MIKAVFIDYTGTMTQEENHYAIEMAKHVTENSNISNIKEAIQLWWGLVIKAEIESYLDTFLTEDEIITQSFHYLEEHYDLKMDVEEFRALDHQYWSKSPIFDDVKKFFDQCPLPIYIITNNGKEYVNIFLEDHDLHPQDIICGDMVRAYKPHKEIFEKALEVSQCSANEVIHIGDSVSSDVKGALSVGIQPILLDRTNTRNSDEYRVCTSLLEVLELLK